MNTYFLLAAGISAVSGVLHSILGERLIFSKLAAAGLPENTRITGVCTPGATLVLASRERGLVGFHGAARSPGVEASYG